MEGIAEYEMWLSFSVQKYICGTCLVSKNNFILALSNCDTSLRCTREMKISEKQSSIFCVGGGSGAGVSVGWTREERKATTIIAVKCESCLNKGWTSSRKGWRLLLRNCQGKWLRTSRRRTKSRKRIQHVRWLWVPAKHRRWKIIYDCRPSCKKKSQWTTGQLCYNYRKIIINNCNQWSLIIIIIILTSFNLWRQSKERTNKFEADEEEEEEENNSWWQSNNWRECAMTAAMIERLNVCKRFVN